MYLLYVWWLLEKPFLTKKFSGVVSWPSVPLCQMSSTPYPSLCTSPSSSEMSAGPPVSSLSALLLHRGHACLRSNSSVLPHHCSSQPLDEHV